MDSGPLATRNGNALARPRRGSPRDPVDPPSLPRSKGTPGRPVARSPPRSPGRQTDGSGDTIDLPARIRALEEKNQALEKENKQLRESQQRAGTSPTSAAEPNIKQRLDTGEYETMAEDGAQDESGQWWRTDLLPLIHRLRNMRTIRTCCDESDEALWPQLVVLGDGNTGKSTVLNRFAQFNFSAVADGICTRRPVRLELRPVSIENRSKMHELDAICTVKDYRSTGTALRTVGRDGETAEEPIVIPFRKSHRVERVGPDGTVIGVKAEESDDYKLRLEVQARASQMPPKKATKKERKNVSAKDRHDRRYIMDELVITIEAPQAIHFDLVDLPGMENGSDITKGLVKKYINRDTLDRTFLLLFQAATRGDTRMQYSLCLNHITEMATLAKADQLERDPSLSVDDLKKLGMADFLGDFEQFMKFQCMGVITMFDRVLESSKDQPAAEYDSEAAENLKKMLNVTYLDPETNEIMEHLQTRHIDWVCVLNPNKNEQAASMPFDKAIKKETWFFDQLVGEDPDTRSKCGIGNFRRLLIEKYERFAVDRFPVEDILKRAIETHSEIKSKYGWCADEEKYDEPALQCELLQEFIRCIVKADRHSKNTLVPDSFLKRDDIRQIEEQCKNQRKVAPSVAATEMKKIMATAKADLMESCTASTEERIHSRFPEMTLHVLDAVRRLASRFETDFFEDALDTAEKECVDTIEQGGNEHINAMAIISTAEQQLLDFCRCFEQLPKIDSKLLSKVELPGLEHTQLCTDWMRKEDDGGNFGLDLDDNGVVLDSSRSSMIPAGSTVLCADGQSLLRSNKKGFFGAADTIMSRLESFPEGQAVLIEHCRSTNLVPLHAPANIASLPKSDEEPLSRARAKALSWLTPECMDEEYRAYRNEFMRYRRAAELMLMTLSDKISPQRLNEAAQLNGAQWSSMELLRDHDGPLARPLICLGASAGPYKGKALDGPNSDQTLYGADASGAMARRLPGLCSTPGCYQPHDTSFAPCGHTVCCYDCALRLMESSQHGKCPVCNYKITGIDLCYASEQTKGAWKRSATAAASGDRRMRVTKDVTVRETWEMDTKGIGKWKKGTEINVLEDKRDPRDGSSQLFRARLASPSSTSTGGSSSSNPTVGWIKASSSKNQRFVEEIPNTAQQPEPEPEPEPVCTDV